MDKAKDKIKSRRDFLTLKNKADNSGKPGTDPNNGKIKMLTSDGRLVEVDTSIIESSKKKKASNMDIMEWSDNKAFQKP